MKLFINWMYAFKFSESKLIFFDSAYHDDTQIKESDDIKNQNYTEVKIDEDDESNN